MLIQIQLLWLLVGSLVRLLVGKSYHTKQKDDYSLPTNSLTNNRISWIWMSKKIRLKTILSILGRIWLLCAQWLSGPLIVSESTNEQNFFTNHYYQPSYSSCLKSVAIDPNPLLFKVILVLTQPCADSCVVVESILPIAEH